MNGRTFRYAVSGAAAGAINGLFGAGGGMALVPLLSRWSGLDSKSSLATSVAVMLPLSAVSAAVYFIRSGLSVSAAAPYLAGGLLGGLVGGLVFKRLPAALLRRLLGAFIIYGGIRSLIS